MAKYVFVYTGGSMPATEADQAAVMQAWGAWFGGLGNAVVDGGNPFSGDSRRISSDGAVHHGSVGVAATGYSILEAASFDAAVAMAKGCPHLQSGGDISVYEAIPM